MKIQTSNLIGRALDWAVAKCEGVNEEAFRLYYEPQDQNDLDSHGFPEFHYSTVWSQGGKILDRQRYTLTHNENDDAWEAYSEANYTQTGKYERGPTALVALMRYHVASNLGDEVEIPDGLADELAEPIAG